MKRLLRGVGIAACLGLAAIGLPKNAAAQTLTVNTNSVSQTLNGMAWGINLLGWSNTTHSQMSTFNELGMKSVRYPSGLPGNTDNFFTDTTVPYPWTTFCSDMAAAGVPGRNMLINLPYGIGKPSDGADWVRDANINRHLGIRYWELGNEVYTQGQDFHGQPGYDPGRENDPITYANEYVAWRNAMRAVDPNIKLGAVGLNIRQWGVDPYGDTVVNPVTGQTMNDWQSIMLWKLGQLGVTPDFLIQHHYNFGSFNETDAGLLSGIDQFGQDLPSIIIGQDRADINAYIPNPSAVEILGTEYGFIWDAPGKISTNLPGALYMAEVLGDSINNGMKEINWYCFDDSDTPPPNTNPSTCDLASSLYGWRIYGQWGVESSNPAALDRHCEFYVSKLLAKFTMEGDQVSACTSNQSNLKIYAVKHPDGTMSIVVVNIAPSTDYNNIPINLTGFSAGGNATVWTYGKANDTAAQNNQAGQDLTQTTQAVSGSTITRSYPQYSVTLMTFGATASTSGPASVNAGGPTASPFVADTDFSGGTIATNWTGAIDTTAVSSPAPQAVYQSERYGASTYTFPGLTIGGSYTVRLHFCENWQTASGLRKFNVAINGTSVLTNFDIFATTGAIHKANVQQFNTTGNASGQVVIAFTNVTDNALINGIEVLPGIPAPPTGLTAVAGNAQVILNWTASTGATTYNILRSTVSGSGYASVATGIAPTTYTNTGLTNGTAYYFVVTATNASGTSGNSAQAAATPVAPIQAQIASGTPVIDGTVDAVWSTAASYGITKIGGTVSSSADLSASWQGLWDATNLYVLVNVTDDVKINDSVNPWDDDAVEIFLDADHNGGTVYDANDRQIVCGWGDAAPVEAGSRSITGAAFGKTDPTGTTYIIEAKIPWTIEAYTAAANNIIGIDVHVDDDDDGGARDGKIAWNDGTDQAWNNPSLFGTGKLVANSAPLPPTGLTATPGNAQVVLNWTASTGATTYNALRSTVSGSGYASVATGIGSTTYTNTGLINGTAYYYVVTATNASGTSGNSGQASATPIAPPAAPTGLTAVPGIAQAWLTWSASPSATTYNVKRSTVSGSGYATVGSPATTYFSNSGLTNGTTYYYVVTAVNAGGESGNSAQVSAVPNATVPQAQIASGTATIDGTVDAAWANATTYLLSKTSGTISSYADCSATWQGMWDATNLYILVNVTDDAKVNDSVNPWDDDSVEVYLDADHNGGTVYDANDRQVICGWGDAAAVEGAGRAISGVAFAKADPTSTSYRIEAKIPWAVEAFTPAANAVIGIDVHVNDDDDGGARDGKIHWNDATDQAYTNPSLFGAGMLVGGGTPPPAPTGLTAVPGNAQVVLAWNASTGATSYNVLRSTVSGSGYASVATGIATTTYTNTGLTNGTQYYFVVQAVSTGGASGNSNQAAAKPVLAPTFVQVNSNDPVTASSIAVAYTTAQVAGNLNIVVVGWNDLTGTVSSVTDSAGNTYSRAIGPTVGSGQQQSIYYASNIKGGANTVTVTMSGVMDYPDIRVSEYTGVSTLDVTAGASGTSATPNSGAATTTTARELIFSANTCYPATTAPGSGFTTRITTVDGDITEDKSVTVTGTNSGSATLGASNFWVMQMATFK